MSGEERRQHERVTDLAVELLEYQGTDGVLCTSIVDISRGGIRLKLSGPESPGKQIALRFKLPDQDPAQVEARVVWARQREPFEVGLRFLSEAPSDLDLP